MEIDKLYDEKSAFLFYNGEVTEIIVMVDGCSVEYAIFVACYYTLSCEGVA